MTLQNRRTRSGLNSESWPCRGCAAPMIGRKPGDDRCPDGRQAAGTVAEVRLLGGELACDVLTAILAAYPGVNITGQSVPRRNRRAPGCRLYLTVSMALPQGETS